MMARNCAAAWVAVVAGALVLTGCSGNGGTDTADSSADGGPLTMWVQEDLPDRLAAIESITTAWTETSGVDVEVVSVAEDQFTQLVISSAAAGDLPDVVGGVSLSLIRTLQANDLIDTEAVGAAVENLDPATFVDNALSLTQDGDTQLAVPSESWSQVLYYRTDLFDAAGLEAPTTYEAITTAAETLSQEGNYGFVGATAAGDTFTEQTFEHVALGNGCQLVDESGEVTLDSPECVEALRFYGDLTHQFGPPGAQDVDTTRAAYFAGDAPMFIWSTFVLDELAGLRNDTKPSCPECVDDPGFLAANTGVVTSVEGPDGQPAAYGDVLSWSVLDGAAAESQDLVEYMMSDGYEDWIGVAPEGKVPTRTGTPDEPTRFSDAWPTMDVGVDTKAPLADFFDAEVMAQLASGAQDLERWGITQGQGALLGAIQGEHPVAQAVADVAAGGDAEQAATTAAESVRSVQESLE